MGIFPGESFDTGKVQLQDGDKVVIYTDGVECALDTDLDDDSEGPAPHQLMFEELARCSATELSSRTTSILDGQSGSINPLDDVTILTLEVSPMPVEEGSRPTLVETAVVHG